MTALRIVAVAVLLAGAFGAGGLWGWNLRPAHRVRRCPAVAQPSPDEAPHGDHAAMDTLSSLEVETWKLHDAMCAYLTDVDHVGAGQCVRRNLYGLAEVLVAEVDRMHRNGEWVPLGREKAPAFLASLVRFEQSWWWEHPRRGRLGEVCMFQLGEAARRNAGYSADQAERSPASCTRGAILWMALGRSQCWNGSPGVGEPEPGPEAWLGWYATRGECGGARAEVEKRLDAARWMLRWIARNS